MADDEIKWEYRVVTLHNRRNIEAEHLARTLNEEGKHGWRLVPLEVVDDQLIFTRPLAPPAPPKNPAVRGVLSLNKGANMGLSVDTTPGAESVTFTFDDDDDNIAAAPTGDGSGVAVVLSAGDSLTTVGDTTQGTDPASGNPTYTAPITVATTVANDSPGAQFDAAVSNVSGAPLNLDDGVTPFPAVAPLFVPLVAGDPVEGSLSVAATPGV